MAGLGVQPGAALESIQAAFGGAQVGQVYEGSRVVDLVVVLDPRIRNQVPAAANLRLRAADGRMLRLGDIADVGLTGGRYKILHASGRRLQTVTAGFEGRDLASFDAQVREHIAQQVRLSRGNYLVFAGTARAQAQAREDLIVHSLIAGIGIFLLLYVAFNNLRNLAITFLNLPFAMIGGVLAVLLASGGWMSLGSLVGFVTLFGITLRNSIMLVSHYQYLVQVEGMPWGTQTALRGASERLPSILMTALVTALALLPLALGTGEPGREIEGPMASIIVGGLLTSTVLNLLILPTILLHFGRFERRSGS
jgi:Cu/Ag efflux pump CusA